MTITVEILLAAASFAGGCGMGFGTFRGVLGAKVDNVEKRQDRHDTFCDQCHAELLTEIRAIRELVESLQNAPNVTRVRKRYGKNCRKTLKEVV
jgi:hypothetical protein